jgi:hypothetical protein
MNKFCSTILTIILFCPIPSNSTITEPEQLECYDSNYALTNELNMHLSGLNMSQKAILFAAKTQAISDGQHPEIVQGIILQESKAGESPSYKVTGGKGSNQYFGLGQIKLSTAREVMNEYPSLWGKYSFQTRTDDELKANLILNDRFNIEVTSKYLRILHNKYGFTGTSLLTAYNKGPGVTNRHGGSQYAQSIGVKISQAKRIGLL